MPPCESARYGAARYLQVGERFCHGGMLQRQARSARAQRAGACCCAWRVLLPQRTSHYSADGDVRHMRQRRLRPSFALAALRPPFSVYLYA